MSRVKSSKVRPRPPPIKRPFCLKKKKKKKKKKKYQGETNLVNNTFFTGKEIKCGSDLLLWPSWSLQANFPVCPKIPFPETFTCVSEKWHGGGGTHIFGQTGMCRPNGSLFYKKSLNMGPVFYKKSLNMGQLIWLSPIWGVFRMA